jgi:hypothetical protein
MGSLFHLPLRACSGGTVPCGYARDLLLRRCVARAAVFFACVRPPPQNTKNTGKQKTENEHAAAKKKQRATYLKKAL